VDGIPDVLDVDDDGDRVLDKFDRPRRSARAAQEPEERFDLHSRLTLSLDQTANANVAWLNKLWSQYQAGIVKARKLDPGAVADYANNFAAFAKAQRGDLAAVALEKKLVTDLKSRREFEDQVKAMVGEDEKEHTFRGIPHWDYLAAVRATKALHLDGDRVGVVVASGEILDGEQPPGTVGSDSLARLLRDALHNDSIKAVVLRIDSPGGSMFASEVIRREIDALRDARKPVIASMSSVAASGGYYIAMDADQIWASPATLTGSIGVFAVFPTVERTLGKFGITIDGVGTTPLADSLRLDRTLHDQAKDILQSSVEHAYSVFVDNVATARKKSFDDIDAVAQGRVWAGADAREHGLVDHLGSYKDALNAAAKAARLSDDYKVEYIEPPLGWREAIALQSQALAARFGRAVAPERQLIEGARRWLAPLEEELARLSRFTDPKQVYYYCACSVN
jgi:protease-4